MNIFFDLDGTLIDSRPRLYKLFQFLVPASELSFDAYWNLKRNKKNHHHILTTMFGYDENKLQEFESKWMAQIELKEWLALDTPFNGVGEMLAHLSNKYQLFIVTARQSESNAIDQIEKFGWMYLFSKVFVTGQKLEKYDLLNNNVAVSTNDWFVGDTGKDIQTGKLLGINTLAVLSGFLNQESLIPYKPDVITNQVTDLISILHGKF
jgi:phosphoglycolate phosphatase